MLRFIFKRILLMIPTLLTISVVSFIIIQAPPGDYLTVYISQLSALGEGISEAEIMALRLRYGLDLPIHIQYFKWLWGVLNGKLGYSLAWNQPVGQLILKRLPWSLAVSFAALIVVYLVAIPTSVLAARHPYSIRDYVLTFLGFIGLSIPNFLFALILLWFFFVFTGNAAMGLFSPGFQMAPWSFAKLVDLIKHLWLPAVIIGTAGTASVIRIMRANLLDELGKPYVMVARSKGLSERKVVYKYPFRIALNPVISTIGWTLPYLINGEILTSIVLGLPTIAPIFLSSLLNQDMFLAGSIVLVLSTLTVVGTLVSDILLAWLDPRIKESI